MVSKVYHYGAGGGRRPRSISHHCGALRALWPSPAAPAEGQGGAGCPGLHLLPHDAQPAVIGPAAGFDPVTEWVHHRRS